MHHYSWKDLYKDAMDYFLLNLIFVAVVLLGVGVTFGAALKALFYVSRKISKHDQPVAVGKDFWKSFTDHFLFATGYWLLMLLVGFVTYFAWQYAFDKQQIIVLASLIVSSTVLIGYLLYLYPLMAFFQTESWKQMLKNTFILFARNPFTTLKLLGSLALVVLLFFLFSGTILFSIGIFAWLNTWHLQKLLLPYFLELAPSIPENQEDREETSHSN